VRWVECVQALGARGLPTLVECGPGKVLAGMTKRISAEMQGLALFDPASLAEVKIQLEACAMNEIKFEGPGGTGDRRLAWHWCGHCA
jgi:malonyl CoA-acyl carrier protein transacylase